MNSNYSLDMMTNDELLARLNKLVGDDNQTTAWMLAHIAEMGIRDITVAASSLFPVHAPLVGSMRATHTRNVRHPSASSRRTCDTRAGHTPSA